MKKYYVTGPRRLELRDETLPDPGPGQVLIRTRVSALSTGTEVWRYINGGHYGGEGSACGYNSVGVVVAVGPGVTQVRPGDVAFAAEPHAEAMVVDARKVVPLPPDVDYEAAAFTYLPTLGLHALRSAAYTPGENVLVIGQGIVGVLAAQVARLVGARVVAFEPDATRRLVAQRAGVERILDPRADESNVQVEAFFGEPGPDVIIETSQSWSGLADAIRVAHAGTRIAVVGIYRADPAPDIAAALLRASLMDRDHFHNQHVRFIGCSNDPAEDYPPDAVRWTIKRNMQYVAEHIIAGTLAPARAITHRFCWNDLEQVYDRLASGDRSMVGITLDWDSPDIA